MAQIKKKNIGNDQVGAAKVRLENNQWLRGRNAADGADVNMARVNASNVLEFASIPQASGTPSANNDLATVSFVKAIAAGLRDPKDACRVASLAQTALTGGATLSIDNKSLANGDRVLLRAQDNAEENGIYVVSGIGDAYVLSRSSDADESAEVTQGISTYVVEGDTYGRTGWLLATPDPIVLGTTELTFVQVPIPDTVVFQKENFTLVAQDITNQYVDCAYQARSGSMRVIFNGLEQVEGTDYTLSVVSNKTRITFSGDLATGGGSELVATDVLNVAYAK